MAKLIFIGEDEKEIVNYGVYKPGDEVDFDETLLSTGLFSEKTEETQPINTEVGA